MKVDVRQLPGTIVSALPVSEYGPVYVLNAG